MALSSSGVPDSRVHLPASVSSERGLHHMDEFRLPARMFNQPGKCANIVRKPPHLLQQALAAPRTWLPSCSLGGVACAVDTDLDGSVTCLVPSTMVMQFSMRHSHILCLPLKIWEVPTVDHEEAHRSSLHTLPNLSTGDQSSKTSTEM